MTWDINDGSLPEPVTDTHTDCRCLLAYIGEEEIDVNWMPNAKEPPKDLLILATFKKPPKGPKYRKSPEGRDIFDVDIEETL